MASTDFKFTVIGSYPFPLDMLRRDNAEAATPEDQAAIDRLSGEYAPDDKEHRHNVTINLVMRDAGRRRPTSLRWADFRWQVKSDFETTRIREERARAARHEETLASAKAKLTEEELYAIEGDVLSRHI